jgi:hypothetical protein
MNIVEEWELCFIKSFIIFEKIIIMKKGLKKYIIKYALEFFVIVLGISFSFWINESKIERENIEKEQQVLSSLIQNISEIKVSLNKRKVVLDEENNLMNYLSQNWENLNIDSLVMVLDKGKHIKSFHNLFLDYREFHPPSSEIQTIISDGSIGLIQNKDIKLKIISTMDRSYESVTQNVRSEIELQQFFRELLITDESLIDSNILQTTFKELAQRFRNTSEYRNKTKKELIAITQFKPAKNYLNLKLRQRYWVMVFINQFTEDLDDLSKMVSKEIETI